MADWAESPSREPKSLGGGVKLRLKGEYDSPNWLCAEPLEGAGPAGIPALVTLPCTVGSPCSLPEKADEFSNPLKRICRPSLTHDRTHGVAGLPSDACPQRLPERRASASRLGHRIHVQGRDSSTNLPPLSLMKNSYWQSYLIKCAVSGILGPSQACSACASLRSWTTTAPNGSPRLRP